MGTANTVTDMAVKPETVTYALQATQVSDGVDANNQPKFKTVLKAISRDKEIAAAKEKGEVIAEQSFSYDVPGTIAGILEVIKDEEEALNIFKAGLRIKLSTKIKNLLEEQDEDGNPEFQPVEGNYDMRDALNEPAQRRNLSPTDKAVRVLIGLGMSKEAALALVSQAHLSAAQTTSEQAA